jgi:hypothetical protein
MTNENTKTPPQPSARMVEDKARERQKKRDRERGLITIDANGKKAKESAVKESGRK